MVSGIDFSILPPEISTKIFSNIPQIKDLGSASKVSKAWNAFACDNLLWKSLFLRDFNWCPEGEPCYKSLYQAELFFRPSDLQFVFRSSSQVIVDHDTISYSVQYPYVFVDTAGNDCKIKTIEGNHWLQTIKSPIKRSHLLYCNNLLFFASHQKIQVWEVTTGNLLHTIEGGYAEYYQPERNILVTRSSKEIKVWDLLSGKLLRNWELFTKESDQNEEVIIYEDDKNAQSYEIRNLLVEGDTILLQWLDGDITFMSIKEGCCLKTFSVDPGSQIVHYRQNRLITVNELNLIKVWNVSEKKCILTLNGYRENYLKMRGNILFLGHGTNGIVEVWDIEEAKQLTTFDSKCRPLWGIEIYGNSLITVEKEPNVQPALAKKIYKAWAVIEIKDSQPEKIEH